jgi:hypothetical protein
MKYAIIVLLLLAGITSPVKCGQMLHRLRERRLLIRVPVMWIPIITAAFGAGAQLYAVQPPYANGVPFDVCTRIIEKVNRPDLFPHNIRLSAECVPDEEFRRKH